MRKNTNLRIGYIPKREYNTYNVIRYIAHRNRPHIWGDYEIVCERRNRRVGDVAQNLIRNLDTLGGRLGGTKHRNQLRQTTIKNRWIQQVAGEIRENFRPNHTRQVWRRLNQRKENAGAQRKNIELRDQDGERQSAIPKILHITHQHMRNEHYKAPDPARYQIIDAALCQDPHEVAKNEIRPKINQTRNNSRTRKYFATNYGSSDE